MTKQRTGWFKSSHSATNGTCVEVRFGADATDVRDSKNPGARSLAFTRAAWATFLEPVR